MEMGNETCETLQARYSACRQVFMGSTRQILPPLACFVALSDPVHGTMGPGRSSFKRYPATNTRPNTTEAREKKHPPLDVLQRAGIPP